jgi:hypothetical protein
MPKANPAFDPRRGSYTDNQKKYIVIGMNYVGAVQNQKLEELLRRCREERHNPSYSDLLTLIHPEYTRNGIRDQGPADIDQVAAG